jgi:hypothetical protein
MSESAATTSPEEWERLARLLYRALDGIFIEELNGRICALPNGMPDLEGNVPPVTACKSCQGHWKRTQEALREFEKVVPRKPVFSRG